MKIALSPLEKFRAAGKFLDCTFNKRPLTVSIEVTKRCNARCDFCDYWKISDRDEMTDFTDVIRRFDPLVVVFTGGEPMLRRDLVLERWLARLARGRRGRLGAECESSAVRRQTFRTVALLAVESGDPSRGQALDSRVIYGMEFLGHAAASNGASIKPRTRIDSRGPGRSLSPN